MTGAPPTAFDHQALSRADLLIHIAAKEPPTSSTTARTTSEFSPSAMILTEFSVPEARPSKRPLAPRHSHRIQRGGGPPVQDRHILDDLRHGLEPEAHPAI